MNRAETKAAKSHRSSRRSNSLRELTCTCRRCKCRVFAANFWPEARLLLILLVSLTWTLRVAPALAQAPGSQAAIHSPQAGEALQGRVTISGSSDVTGFVMAEVAFAYADDPTGTWFRIAAGGQPVRDGTLAVWDTTTITDGLYTLRLRVTLADGSFADALAPDLRVRNYTPVETATPTAAPLEATPIPAATSTATPFPTPTPLPPNPAALTASAIYSSLGYGALSVIAILILLALYLRLRRT